jgi:hypothetical protein
METTFFNTAKPVIGNDPEPISSVSHLQELFPEVPD